MPPPPRAKQAKRTGKRHPQPVKWSSRKRPAPTEEPEKDPLSSELVFEDPYGDEFEQEVPHAPQKSENGKAMHLESPMLANNAVVFRPGKDTVADNEALVCDESAYDVFYKCKVEWPAQSFDFICMNADGAYNNLAATRQSAYPLSATIVMGTQADVPSKNKLVFAKMTNLRRTSRKKAPGIGVVEKKPGSDSTDDDDDDDDDGDDDDDDDDDEDEEDENENRLARIADRNAILENAEIKVESTINRVRVMPQRSNIIAYWCENGRVHIVDGTSALDMLNLDSKHRMLPFGSKPPSTTKPFFTHNMHRIEGYALDWSRVKEGRLLSGALNSSIYLTEPTGSSDGAKFATGSDRFRGHKKSVEDLQWSPNEAEVFASCSQDQSIRIWDAREYRRNALAISEAHSSDVNVISWNHRETHLLASGGDDGIIRVWDMRTLSGNGEGAATEAAAEFKQHQDAITAVQWHPTDASMLCGSSEDGAVTVWDLAVERDAEEELREGVVLEGAEEFPPQLLFIHMGQKNVKEAQWHPACPSLIVSTAEDGLNLFQPSNIALPL